MLKLIKRYLYYIVKLAICAECYRDEDASELWLKAEEAYLLVKLAQTSDPCWITRVNQLTNGFTYIEPPTPPPVDDP